MVERGGRGLLGKGFQTAARPGTSFLHTRDGVAFPQADRSRLQPGVPAGARPDRRAIRDSPRAAAGGTCTRLPDGARAAWILIPPGFPFACSSFPLSSAGKRPESLLQLTGD